MMIDLKCLVFVLLFVRADCKILVGTVDTFEVWPSKLFITLIKVLVLGLIRN